MKFLKKNYKAIIGIGLLMLLVTGIGIAQVLIENKDKPKAENNENELVVEEQQSNERDETVKQLEITTDYINIRSNSNVNSKIIGKVYKGEIYTILEEVGTDFDWYLIETNTGIKGYVAGKSGEDVYVNVLSPVNEETEENTQEENNNTNNTTNNNKPSNNTNQNNNSQNNNKPQNNNDNNVQANDNQNNSDNTQQEDNYEPQLPPCLITSCGEGEELKNPNSTDCYCEKVSTFKPLNKVIYDKHGVVVTVVGYDPEITRTSSGIRVHMVNNSNEDRTIQLKRPTYVNDIDITAGTFSTVLLPGTQGTNDITFSRSNLEANGITNINKIVLRLRIAEWDGVGLADTIIITDWITINI